MATSKDFEKIWIKYQNEVQSTGKSIVTYCQENGIVYSQFERWYKSKGRSSAKVPQLVPVEVMDIPEKDEQENEIEYPTAPRRETWIRSFSIQFKNGLELRHQNISYRSLVELVGKLEALC